MQYFDNFYGCKRMIFDIIFYSVKHSSLKWSDCCKDFLVGKYIIIFGYSIPTSWKTKIINPTHPPKKSPDIVMERSCSKVGLIRYPLWGRQRAFSWAGITNARLKTSRKEEYSSSDVCNVNLLSLLLFYWHSVLSVSTRMRKNNNTTLLLH